jgi:hypothetical protein
MYSGKIAVPPGGGGLRLGNVLYTNYKICANHVGASCLKELPFFNITYIKFLVPFQRPIIGRNCLTFFF